MGLDMYAGTLNEAPETPTDFDAEGAGRLHYWRKHPDLHGWMERLYREKGGQAETFNLTTVVVTLADLDRLEEDVRDGRLPPTSGFFFGSSGPEDAADDLAFIKKAREAIADGKTVFYDSWW